MCIVDFIGLIKPKLDSHSLVYFDPPYYNQGAALYENFYTKESHEELAECISRLNCRWVLTYDYTPDIIELYKNEEKRLLTINYTAAKKTAGWEMIAFSKGLIIPAKQYNSIKIE